MESKYNSLLLLLNNLLKILYKTYLDKHPTIIKNIPTFTTVLFLEIFNTKNKKSRSAIASVSIPKKEENVFLNTKSNFSKKDTAIATTSTKLTQKYKQFD